MRLSALEVDTPTTWPSSLREPLSAPAVQQLFRAHSSYEDIRSAWALRPAIVEIERYVRENGLVVYHCTKELFPGKIASEGLRVLNQQAHVDEFLAYTLRENILTQQEREEIEPVLRKWRDGTQHVKGREGTLHFVHSRPEVLAWGTQKFFLYYGGEALYWPFGPWTPKPKHWFLRRLETIGEAVVVAARVDPRDLITGSESSGADIGISYFARLVNPAFEPWSRFCLTKKTVPPGQILSTIRLADFAKALGIIPDWAEELGL